MLSQILDLLYPAACAVCRTPLLVDRSSGTADSILCGACRPEAGRVCNPPCARCSEEATKGAFLCDECAAWPLPFASLRSCWKYGGSAEQAIKAYKYAGERRLAAYFASELFRETLSAGLRSRVDLIVPVPSTLASLASRGFGHMALIATALGRRLRLPADIFALDTRNERRPPQASLQPEDRVRNMRGQMIAGPERVRGRRVLLIDDVLTTGASLWASADALRRAGAASIDGMTLARSGQFRKSRRVLSENMMRRGRALLLILFFFAGCGGNEREQRVLEELQSAKSDLARLDREVNELRSELEKIRDQPPSLGLDASGAVARMSYTVNASMRDDPFLGDPAAPVLVMAFTEYQCRRCAAFAKDTLPKLKEEFIDTGKVRFVLRDYPLNSHPHAVRAARLANCAGEQGQYWAAHDLLFSSGAAVEKGETATLGAKLERVDQEKLKRCLLGKRYAKEIDLDVADAKKVGTKGTPGFFIGARVTEDALYRGVFIRGAQPYAVFRAEIKKLLPR